MATYNSTKSVEVVGALDTGSLITTITGQASNLLSSIFGRSTPISGGTSTTPKWLLPTIIGGIGVIALSMFATSKKR